MTRHATVPLQTRPLGRLDRIWSGTTIVAVVGPVQVPDTDTLRQRYAALAAARPELRLDVALRDGHWVRRPIDAAFLAERVRDDAYGFRDAPFAEAARRMLLADDGDAPVWFTREGEWLALRMTHCLGDGRLVETLLGAIVGRDQTPHAKPTTARPLLTSAVRFFGRRPGAAARILLDAGRARSAPPGDGGPPSANAREEGVAYAVMEAATFSHLRHWRREHLRGVPLPAVELSGLHRAFRDAGIALDDDATVPYDARRYLPAGSSVHGNFSVGVRISLREPNDPAQLSRRLTEAAESGRPLTALMTAYLPHRRTRHARRAAADVEHEAGPVVTRLAFTHLGRPGAVERLPWTSSRHVYAGVVQGHGPGGLTLAVTETGGEMHISTSFNRLVVPQERLRAALERFTTDPVGVLSGAAVDVTNPVSPTLSGGRP